MYTSAHARHKRQKGLGVAPKPWMDELKSLDAHLSF
jgi:hypothetical protein